MTIRVRTRSLAAAGAVGLFVIAGAAPAHAQAWIGQMVGEMAAQQAAAMREAECRKGKPADPDDVAASNRRADKLMEAYFALTSKSSKREIAALFVSDRDIKDVTWKDDSGAVPIAQLGPQLDEASDKHARVLSVVGGDNHTTRAIWSVGEGDAVVYYGVDIINGTWLTSAKIWHMTVSRTLPETPPAYCHFDPEQSF